MKKLLVAISIAVVLMGCTEQPVTAYTASYEECGKTDGITASGVKATEGRTIACDFLAFGMQKEITQVYGRKQDA